MLMSTDNGFKLEGFISIELVNKRDNIRRVYKNTITNAGKQFLLDQCVQSMLGMSADLFGRGFESTAISRKCGNDPVVCSGRVATQDRDITNALFNLGEDVTLNANSTFVNAFDENFQDASKLIGYANSNVAPLANGKEGTLDYCKGEYMADPFVIAKRWKYPEGVATGTIDTVAMVPAGTAKYNNADGVRFMKCVDRVNLQSPNFVALSTGFLPPGILGFTGNDEILLNFNQDGNDRWKYNITTGEIAAVGASDPFFVVPVNSRYVCTDIVLEGNYLYVLRVEGAGGSTASPDLKIEVYDVTSGATLTEIDSFTVTTSNTYAAAAKFLKIGSQMYVTTIGTDKATNLTPKKLFKLEKGSKQFWSDFGTSYTDFTEIGVTLPSGLNINQVGFGNYKGQYVMYQYAPLAGMTVGRGDLYGYKMRGLIFGSLSNLDPSKASGGLFGINPNTIAWTAGSNAGLLQIGFDRGCNIGASGDPDLMNQKYDLGDAVFCVTNNSGSKGVNLLDEGLFLSLDGWGTNIISFVRLQTPIVKGDDDIMYVSYGYKIV